VAGGSGPTGLWVRPLVELNFGPLECSPGLPEGHGLAEWRSCVSVDCWFGIFWGHGSGRDCAGLYRCEGCSPVEIMEACAGLRAGWEEIMNVCGLLAWHVLVVSLPERRSCRPVQAWGVRPSGMEIMPVLITCVAGLGFIALQSGYPAGLCWPGGCSPVEWRLEIMCVWIASLAGLGAWPSRVEIVQVCAGLRAWPGGDCECLWIPGLAGLTGSSGRDRAGLMSGSLW
jgi:hypothetical protein